MTISIYLALSMVIVGSALLAWSADRFVAGASVIARNMGISPLVIGIMILGFATSLPELIVASIAAWQGDPIVGIGGAIGSNIANIGLVLGVSALCAPLAVHSKVLKREFPVLFVTIAFTGLVLSDGYLSFTEGVLLLLGFVALVAWLLLRVTRDHAEQDALVVEMETEIPKMSTSLATVWLVIGLLLLLLSSQLLVTGAVSMAHHFGISDLVIGLTVVAVGTSLPELATSVVSVLKQEPDIALGNILGSCMFNLLAVLAVPGLIHPTVLPKILLWRDFPIMVGFTLALFFMAYGFRGRPGRITRVEGGLLLCAFIAYLGLLAV